MNYAEQRRYLAQSRIWAVALAGVWVLACAAVLAIIRMPVSSAIALGLVAIGIACSLLYAPDYLHLTVNLVKRARWQVMIRWRILGIVLIVGLALPLSTGQGHRLKDSIVLLLTISWLITANLAARKLQGRSGLAAYFWISDWAVLTALLFLLNYDGLVIAGFFAVAAHLSILGRERQIFPWAITVMASSWLTLMVAIRIRGLEPVFFLFGAAMILVSGWATAFLVQRAQERNARNTQAALQELMEFSGYPEEKVRRLWSESDKELARNWVSAALDENDSQALGEWYKQNSELYMFAISGYNLDYKRIRSNLKVLQFGRGACLDYGAGNGEVILELARRGHPTAYYDVDGVSARFAQWRSKQRGLEVEFFHAKEPLAAAASQRPFDTVFSLDVLEHLPDLPGELTFLASLLNSGGVLVFDVPAGTTKSHPMHLNHQVEVRSLLMSKGMKEQRSSIYKLPFVKQEKYVFVAS